MGFGGIEVGAVHVGGDGGGEDFGGECTHFRCAGLEGLRRTPAFRSGFLMGR
jgi:hypothetical protein